MTKSKTTSVEMEKEIHKLDQGFKEYDKSIKSLTLDEMNKAPVEETEPEIKKSTRELQNANYIYLKPKRSISAPQKFNEEFRPLLEHLRQYVPFVAENKEVVGETICLWTRPIGGMPAEEWEVPVNQPVMGPRYLAEQISRCQYHRIIMDDTQPAYNLGVGTMTGAPTIDKTINRLEARPVSEKRTVFMGGTGF